MLGRCCIETSKLEPSSFQKEGVKLVVTLFQQQQKEPLNCLYRRTPPSPMQKPVPDIYPSTQKSWHGILARKELVTLSRKGSLGVEREEVEHVLERKPPVCCRIVGNKFTRQLASSVTM